MADSVDFGEQALAGEASAEAAVTNTAIPDGQRRHYRMKLELVREGETWRTADLEAVG